MSVERVVIITGASSGIGYETCNLFFRNGWKVIGIGRRKMTTPECMSAYYSVDLSKSEEIEDLISTVCSSYQRLDVLVNNAAYQICKPLLDTELAEWRSVFAVNLEAPFLLAKGLFKLLAQAKGSIVNVSSVHAYASSKDISSYAASKAGLIALTRNMAIEFGSAGVRVNAVVPGAVNTPMLEEGLRRAGICGDSISEQLVNIGKKHIIGRVAAPEEIAKVIYFLADNDSSSFVTSQVIIADGGALARLSTE